MNFYTVLKELCLCPSVSGREQNIRKKISALIQPFCHELYTDALGNLIALKRAESPKSKIMLAAHMDEIGFMVTFIEDSGMIRIAPVGGISFSAVSFSSVISEKGVKGVIVPEEGKTKPECFYIDIGARSKKRAEALVSIGDFFVATPKLEKLTANRVCGRPLDDRIGCAVLLSVAEQLWTTDTEDDIYYTFCVQEEVGCRGSKTAAFAIQPNIALCLDVTATGDTVGASPMDCTLGGGAAVKLRDSSVICSEALTKELCRIAQEKNIKYQREILLKGGTDTSSMQLAGKGAVAGALSIPTRYIHSPSELCDIDDALACVSLTVEFIKNKRI